MRKILKRYKNKICSALLLFLFLFSPFFLPITAFAGVSWQDAITLGLGGIPIGKTSTYTFTNTGDAQAKAVCLVNPTEPEINLSTQISCIASPASGVVVLGPPVQSVSKTYTSSGNQSVSFTFKLKNISDPDNPRYGVLYTTVNMNVYAGTTSTATGDTSVAGTTTSNNNNSGTTNTTDGSDDSNDYDNSSALDDLLNDGNNSLNSGDSSNLLDGSSDDLGEYFNGVDSTADDVPGGLTDDLLGVADSLYDEQTPLVENTENESLNDSENNNENYDNNPSDQTEENKSLTMQDLAGMYQQGLAGLDGLTGENNGLLEAISGNGKNSSSLAQKLKDLMSGDSSVANNSAVTASDQDLFDVAKKLLLASGMNLDDIKNGKNYDSNSAYTEPTTSWDFNRITTLLKGRKVKLNGSTDSPNTTTNNKKSSGNINASTNNANTPSNNTNAKLTK